MVFRIVLIIQSWFWLLPFCHDQFLLFCFCHFGMICFHYFGFFVLVGEGGSFDMTCFYHTWNDNMFFLVVNCCCHFVFASLSWFVFLWCLNLFYHVVLIHFCHVVLIYFCQVVLPELFLPHCAEMFLVMLSWLVSVMLPNYFFSVVCIHVCHVVLICSCHVILIFFFFFGGGACCPNLFLSCCPVIFSC